LHIIAVITKLLLLHSIFLLFRFYYQKL